MHGCVGSLRVTKGYVEGLGVPLSSVGRAVGTLSDGTLEVKPYVARER